MEGVGQEAAKDGFEPRLIGKGYGRQPAQLLKGFLRLVLRIRPIFHRTDFNRSSTFGGTSEEILIGADPVDHGDKPGEYGNDGRVRDFAPGLGRLVQGETQGVGEFLKQLLPGRIPKVVPKRVPTHSEFG